MTYIYSVYEQLLPAYDVLYYPPQQAVMGELEDYWSGLSSAAERRRIQNRIHQRAWRKHHFPHSKRDTDARLPPS